MNKFVTTGLGAAALVVLLFVGTQLLDPEPTATPTTTVEASASPEAGPEGVDAFLLFDGTLEDMTGPQVTVTIPTRGWSGLRGEGVLIKDGNPNPPAGAGFVGPFTGDLLVPADPCQWMSTLPDTPATTVDEVVAALTSQAARNASTTADITIDGHPGVFVRMEVPDDLAYAGSFTDCDLGDFCTLTVGVRDDCFRYHQGPGQIDEVLVLDVDGQVMVFDGAYGVETPEETVDEIHAIFDSLTFGE